MTKFAISLLALPLCLAEVRTGRFQNRDSWVIETPTLRVSIMQSGGHIAEIVLKGGAEVNPLWVQNRPTLDAEQYDPAKHEKLYGGGAGARLMSGLVGHNLCFPFCSVLRLTNGWTRKERSRKDSPPSLRGYRMTIRASRTCAWPGRSWRLSSGKPAG